MGDPGNPRTASLSLSPGFRFYPSQEQLISHYLTPQNSKDHRFGFDVIHELDLYSYNPFDLPETACFPFGRGGRKRHWYCYAVARVLREKGTRRAGGGYWKRRGRVRDVFGGPAGKAVVGIRKSFVFYLGDSPKNAVRTPWVMHEYALIDHHKASFVLCRIFERPQTHHIVSEHVVSSCAEESVATVRHIGVQHDGSITSGVEVTAHVGNFVGRKNEVLRFPIGPAPEPDDGISAGAVASSGVQIRSTMQPNELVTISDSAFQFVEGLSAHHLAAILEEDFIELDDLACPVLGTDFAV